MPRPDRRNEIEINLLTGGSLTYLINDSKVTAPSKGNRNGKGSDKVWHGFVDEDGDSFNDNAPDDDADGIQNGQDEDWVRPEDCVGRGSNMNGKGFQDDSGSDNDNGKSNRSSKGRGGRG